MSSVLEKMSMTFEATTYLVTIFSLFVALISIVEWFSPGRLTWFGDLMFVHLIAVYLLLAIHVVDHVAFLEMFTQFEFEEVLIPEYYLDWEQY